jgi:hypothetical protein
MLATMKTTTRSLGVPSKYPLASCTFPIGTVGALGLATAIAFGATAQIPLSPAPAGAEVYFVSPRNGDVVDSTFVVSFGLKGMGVAPAGIDFPNTGHHHLLINLAEELDPTRPLPADETVVHFGAGQTEAEVTLPAGQHRLQLMLGDFLHIPHDPPVKSPVITVTVKPALEI